MKEATGELNMTLITINIIGVVFMGITVIVPRVLNSARDVWGVEQEDNCVNFGMTDTTHCGK
jgi:hypothetical protein